MTHHILAFDDDPGLQLASTGIAFDRDGQLTYHFSFCGIEVDCTPETTVAQLYTLIRKKLAQANDAA